MNRTLAARRQANAPSAAANLVAGSICAIVIKQQRYSKGLSTHMMMTGFATAQCSCPTRKTSLIELLMTRADCAKVVSMMVTAVLRLVMSQKSPVSVANSKT